MSTVKENSVLAQVLYLARLAPEWTARPYWLLRRCVVPYVEAGQYLLIERDGLPAAFAGWSYEREGEATPWREQGYLPSQELIGRGSPVDRCVVTEIIAARLPSLQVVAEVAKYLGRPRAPAWIDRNDERKIIAIHEEESA